MIYKRDSIEGVLQATEDTLVSVCAKYGKAYCYPSQEKILILLKEYHKISISRRSLNRVLRWLEDHGSFRRTRRLKQGKNGKIIFATTLYQLKKKLFIRLNKLKKWVDRVFSPLRVPIRSQYISVSRNMIYKQVSPDVESLWKSQEKGGASPV